MMVIFFFPTNEKAELIAKEPGAAKFIRPLISAREFLNGENRWCLWMVDASPADIRAMPEIMKRVEAVRKYRLASKRDATKKLAEQPTLFGEIRQPNSNYVLIPLHSSENRKYIPISFFDKGFIANNSCATLPNATLYHFGILTSAMHMAWMRQVCGRIKSDYRYSSSLVYNNYPWPENPTPAQKQKVERTVQAVLDARAKFPDETLADLYDPDVMPKSLLEVHKTLDAAVDTCYRKKVFKSELERLEFLFALYRRYTEPLIEAVER